MVVVVKLKDDVRVDSLDVRLIDNDLLHNLWIREVKITRGLIN